MMLRNLLKHGIHHAGYVVKDLQKTMEWFQAAFGEIDFKVYDVITDNIWCNGKKLENFHVKIAMGVPRNGGTNVEIIEPVSTEGIYHEFVQDGVGGLHHISVSADKEDFDHWRNYFDEQGAVFLLESEMEDELNGYRRCFYLLEPELNIILEVREVPYFRNK